MTDKIQPAIDAAKTDAEKREVIEKMDAEATAKLNEARDYADLAKREAEARAGMPAGIARAAFGSAGGRAEYREGTPLGADQTFAGYVEFRGFVPQEQRELNLGRYVRGMVTGEWRGADAERRAMSESVATAGGYLVPTVLSSQIIDLARNKAVVMQAGAQIVPMDSRQVDVAKWTGDPTPGWRDELGAVAESTGTLDKVTLTAQSLAVIVRFSRELAEDAQGLEAEVRNALAEQFALKLDKVALYGTGTAPEPRGVKNVTAVTKTPMATNGAAITSWDPIIDSVGRVRDANESPNAVVYSPRTGRSIAKLRAATDGQYLTVPAYLDGITRIESNQIPNNLAVGTSGTTTSDAFSGNWLS